MIARSISWKARPRHLFYFRSIMSKPDSYLVPIDPTNVKPGVPNLAVEKLWSSSRPSDKADEARLFYVENDTATDLLSVVSLGAKIGKASENARNEALRRASGLGVRKLKDADAKVVAVDTSLGAHAIAEGAHLGLFKFSLKTKEEDKTPLPQLEPLQSTLPKDATLGWQTGLEYAKAQNLARELMELPANFITPTAFCDRVTKEFEGLPNVTIHARDEAWAESQGMRTFLSVTKGTSEPARFLEIHYQGANKGDQPIVFVGKGITFDSGGISIKPAADMKLMRGDMGGAAVVVSTALAIARLRLPVNLVVLTPLCENLPGPAANKPGDIIYAMNGKTVEIDNTDAEGRLILSDALTYGSRTFNAHTIIDVATLTGAMGISLGDVFAGVFSTSDELWTQLHTAGEAEYDRFWRMPLDEGYGPQIYSSNADLCNTGGRPAASCTAALFLKSFVEGIEPPSDTQAAPLRWAHIDIAGVMEEKRPGPYQHKGMTGRPVRALVEFVRRLSTHSS